MSRENNGEPVPMSAARRATLIKELCSALEYDAPFHGEKIVVSCIRIDGDFSELVCVIEGTSAGPVVHIGTGPKQAAAPEAK